MSVPRHPDDDRPYEATDITPINGLEWVRKNPDRVLGRGFRASSELLLATVREGLWDLARGGRTWCEIHDGWGYLTCTIDWIEGDSHDPFRQVVPFPESGLANTMRPEVVVTAFSTVAATLVGSDDLVDVLTGDAVDLPLETVEHARSLLGRSGRAIILRV